MERSVELVIQNTFKQSNAGEIHFGQVVHQLSEAGVESYHVDYRACRATYYMPDGEALTLGLDAPVVEIAQVFSVAAIKNAIVGAQQGNVMYPEFKRLSQLGGCVGYTVWLTGRHVTYFGRDGDTHIERFPD